MQPCFTSSCLFHPNQVTPQLLARLTQSTWVQLGYAVSEVPEDTHIVGNRTAGTLTAAHVFSRGLPPRGEAVHAWLKSRLCILDPSEGAAIAAAVMMMLAEGEGTTLEDLHQP